ncbi:helix-turn-helix domain-containing protein [Actinomarinicola tropica]
MRSDHPLTLTVEQAGQVLGIGRSTAYELIRSGDLKCIRLRRRIVVPVAHLADRPGVDSEAVRSAVQYRSTSTERSQSAALPAAPSARVVRDCDASEPTLF